MASTGNNTLLGAAGAGKGWWQKESAFRERWPFSGTRSFPGKILKDAPVSTLNATLSADGLKLATGGVKFPYRAQYEFGDQNYTLGAWAKRTANEPFHWVMTKWDTAARPLNNSWILNGLNEFSSNFVDHAGTVYTTSPAGSVAQLNTWIHWASRRTGTLLETLCNGVVVSSATLPAGTTMRSAGAIGLYFGRVDAYTAAKAHIDDAFVLGRSASNAEILKLVDAGRGALNF